MSKLLTVSVPLPADRGAALRRIEKLAWFMDSSIRIPLTSRSIGADAVLSFIPGAGTLMGGAMSLYLVAEAMRHGAPLPLLARMTANIAGDTLLGAVPVAGVVFDMVFKANQRNLRLLRQHMEGAK